MFCSTSSVNPVFNNTYVESKMEAKIFKCLDKLVSENPFCDVIYTGHSFGGCLSLFGAARCAKKYPMMTVGCNVFGVPKIGNTNFRNFVHSLPNLRVNRVEYGNDVYTNRPFTNKNDDSLWNHVGHTYAISSLSYTKDGGYDTYSTTPTILAHKFGKKTKSAKSLSPSSSKLKAKTLKIINKIELKPRSKKLQGRLDHKMESYLHALEHIVKERLPWISSFVGEEGAGIHSPNDNEERLIV